MLCDQANKLVIEAKRATALEAAQIPPYNDALVRSICREVRALEENVRDAAQNAPAFQDQEEVDAFRCNVLVQHLAMHRNKRCMLAYHRSRLEKLRELAWAGGGVGGSSSLSSRTRQSLSPHEVEFFKDYLGLLNEYKSGLGDDYDIDVTGATLDPPKDLLIQVRVLKNAGEIVTEYGAIHLDKNSQFYVRRTDVERLIVQGYLQQIK